MIPEPVFGGRAREPEKWNPLFLLTLGFWIISFVLALIGLSSLKLR